jgi:formylglycine-generating enzyme required for sulfatase activity
MPRLFISHSSKDNLHALAFQHWLLANGWAKKDVFVDLDGIGAGQRWRDALRKANAACEAVLLLASPDSLDSKECQRELNLAEDLGKEIIVAILRDLSKDDSRLTRWADRQLVDLSAEPTEHVESIEHDGCNHRVELHLPALVSIKARLADLGIAPDSFAWVPRARATGPFPGLSAFEEEDAGIFFGRDADIVAGITDLRTMRKRRSPRLLVVVAASGAGKSSYLRAGLWPRLMRDPDFVPLCILRPAQGILTGPDGLGRKLAPWFERHGRMMVAGDINAAIAHAGAEAAAAALVAFLIEATALATTVRRAGAPEVGPPAPLIAIDQGEELFATENEAESNRFLELLAAVLRAPPPGVDPYVLITIRADSVEALLQRWPALALDTPQSRYLPPLSPTAYREVIIKPIEVYGDRVRRLVIEPALVEALVKDAHGGDALPLLAFTLERLFDEFGSDGELTLARYKSMGGIGGSIDRSLAQALRKADASADLLRRLIVPGLATWDPSANAAKRLVLKEEALKLGDRATLIPLANALVEARLLTRNRDTLEVAHEALLRRPPIDVWIEAQKDSLKLRDDLEKEAREWESDRRRAKDLLRRGERLTAALDLLRNPDFADSLESSNEYLSACQRLAVEAKRRARRGIAFIMVLMASVICGLLAWINQSALKTELNWYITMRPYMVTQVRPYVLRPEVESALKPLVSFRECANGCPEMIIIPAGSFVMGSPDTEFERATDEGPQRRVDISRSFAVSKFSVTFSDWDACASVGGCPQVSDSGMGRNTRPVINVDWELAQQYASWLSKMTGKAYRLLTEAEWEYAARAGSLTAYPWGDEIGNENVSCKGCGGHWNGGKGTAPSGSFKPNSFGLFDMHGNVWQWVEDCYGSYNDAPTDGSARNALDCSRRVIRGGSWDDHPQYLRSARRWANATDNRTYVLGFRVGRTLSAKTDPISRP